MLPYTLYLVPQAPLPGQLQLLLLQLLAQTVAMRSCPHALLPLLV
jgi:hypothetical protein